MQPFTDFISATRWLRKFASGDCTVLVHTMKGRDVQCRYSMSKKRFVRVGKTAILTDWLYGTAGSKIIPFPNKG